MALLQLKLKCNTQEVCGKYVETTKDTDQVLWNSLELLDNYVRDQIGECDSLYRVLMQIEQQKMAKLEAFRKLEKINAKLM